MFSVVFDLCDRRTVFVHDEIFVNVRFRNTMQKCGEDEIAVTPCSFFLLFEAPPIYARTEPIFLKRAVDDFFVGCT